MASVSKKVAPIPVRAESDPLFAHEMSRLIPVSGHAEYIARMPPSRMFTIRNALSRFRERFPGSETFDASQGDGGMSLPGVPLEILEAAARLQIEEGTAYDAPQGNARFRQAVIESYWNLDPRFGIGAENVIAAVGGRDALIKAYEAMLGLGHGRQGDVLIVSRVPWISYTWGPYGVGANVLLAPGSAADGWALTREAIESSSAYAARSGRRVAGLIITSPDNPTGRTLSAEAQIDLAQTALRSGAAYVLFDWMYHQLTDEEPLDLNQILGAFDPPDRERLIFLDGLTKSLGASNIRNCHLIASRDVARYITAKASHGIIPSYFSQAVGIAVYESGFEQAARSIREPINESRSLLQQLLDQFDRRYISGKGYYAFLEVGPALAAQGWSDSEALGQALAEQHGIAVVPGVHFSKYGKDWIRFSYAASPDTTRRAVLRLIEGLEALEQ